MSFVSKLILKDHFHLSEFLFKELRTEEEAKTKKHSAFNIRVNGVLSLLPEFTNAFGCQKGDAMYVEEKDS